VKLDIEPSAMMRKTSFIGGSYPLLIQTAQIGVSC